MNPEDITNVFAGFLSRQGIALEQVTPPQALDLMVEFLGSVRFDWVEKYHPDADMLLFQYGVYDWGHGENFELNVTRQLMSAYEEDEEYELYQLEITLFYRAENYKDIPSFNKWSMNSLSITEYVKEMKNTEGYLRACGDVPVKVEMLTQRVH